MTKINKNYRTEGASNASPQEIFSAALKYSALNLPILPIKRLGKSPITQNGVHDATLNPDYIRRWWGRTPTANLGVATGTKSKIVVIDVDPRHRGDESLGQVERTLGRLPVTPMVLTGGGGSHYYFQHPGFQIPNRVNLRPGIDIRGDGGYIVAPPSIHESGNSYRWVPSRSIFDLAPPALPNWLIEMIIQGPTFIKPCSPTENFWDVLVSNEVPQGIRNQTMTQLAGHLLRHYVRPRVTFELLRAWNRQQVNPPLPEKELVQIVNSISKREHHRRMKRTTS